MAAVYVETRDIPICDLTRFPGNAKRGSVTDIRDSVRRSGQYRSLVVRRCDDGTLVVLAGNHTMQALEAEGYETARCEVVTCDDQDAYRINIADNRLAELGGYDNDALAELLSYMDGDYEGTGYTDDDVMRLITPPDLDGLDEDEDDEPAETPTLADRFLVPPMDVLDARQGWWRTRKRQWLSLGMRSEVGRGDNLAFADASMVDPNYYRKKKEAQQLLGRALTNAEFEAEHYVQLDTNWSGGTSVFDPVLCELAYRWFCPQGGTVLDPFAGGSVRGLVAGILGRPYRGNDLRAEQVESNREQRDDFTTRRLLAADPAWTVGDSAEWVTTLEPESADMVFTCPPYYDLEQYSSDPADLSSMSHDDFDAAYARIIAGAARALRPDRFAVFVVGDARDTKGALHDLRGSTIRAATAASLVYASGAVLVYAAGSAAVMAGRTFTATRGMGRIHQDVLVFCKGNRSLAAQACGEVDIHLPEALDAEFANVDVDSDAT
ncbi:ParB N-terminal domain-containing protein [Streptomyces sp. NPDC058299]|uniref:ParB/RepB/Spo0J family partition protein n=1 Tax=Streptomyces sp. NPDC058299 TaxID=3346435 RepID=UPI0036E9A17A